MSSSSSSNTTTTTTRTAKVKKFELGHKLGYKAVLLLADKVTGSSLESIKEAVSNGFDAESDVVHVNVGAKFLTVEDWGTGIRDINNFVVFLSDEKQIEAEREGKPKPIGEMHVGKLSYWKLSPKVLFLSNNGNVGYKIYMLKYPEPGHEAFQVELNENPNAFLKHKGTKVVIENPIYKPRALRAL